MNLALSISLKPGKELAPDEAEAEAELDGAEVLDAVVHALSQLGTVRVWDTTSMTPVDIASQERPDIVFNLSEGVNGSAREAQAPALFEWLRWHYVGSDPVTLALTLDKWYTKCALWATGIPTPRATVLHSAREKGVEGFTFPLLVKPVAEGSGKGVDESGVVESWREVASWVESHLLKYRQPILVEEFLPGREFTVALIGNRGKWDVLPIVEVNFAVLKSRRYPVFGYNAKWAKPSPDDTLCPARLSNSLRAHVEKVAVAACDALRIRDWGRVDVRLDRDGTPNVLEVNALPGILPGVSDISCFTSAAYAAGFDYDGMIHRVLHTALERYGSTTFISSLEDASDSHRDERAMRIGELAPVFRPRRLE